MKRWRGRTWEGGSLLLEPDGAGSPLQALRRRVSSYHLIELGIILSGGLLMVFAEWWADALYSWLIPSGVLSILGIIKYLLLAACITVGVLFPMVKSTGWLTHRLAQGKTVFLLSRGPDPAGSLVVEKASPLTFRLEMDPAAADPRQPGRLRLAAALGAFLSASSRL